MSNINKNPEFPHISQELEDELVRRKVPLTPSVRLWCSTLEAVLMVAGKRDRMAIESVAAETKGVLRTLGSVAVEAVGTALNGEGSGKGIRGQLDDFAREAESIRHEVREHRLTSKSGLHELPRIVRKVKVLCFVLLVIVALDTAVTMVKFVAPRPQKSEPEISNPIADKLRSDWTQPEELKHR